MSGNMGPAAIVFKDWKDSELASYLINTAAFVLEKKDDDGQSLVDKIKDTAAKKGTGRWTLTDAVERGVYLPVIYEAVGVRSFSENRTRISSSCSHAPESPDAALPDSSAYWTQMCADIFGEDMEAADTRHGSLTGAAILALEILGVIKDASDFSLSSTRRIVFDSAMHEKYARKFQRYVTLYENNKN